MEHILEYDDYLLNESDKFYIIDKDNHKTERVGITDTITELNALTNNKYEDLLFPGYNKSVNIKKFESFYKDISDPNIRKKVIKEIAHNKNKNSWEDDYTFTNIGQFDKIVELFKSSLNSNSFFSQS